MAAMLLHEGWLCGCALLDTITFVTITKHRHSVCGVSVATPPSVAGLLSVDLLPKCIYFLKSDPLKGQSTGLIAVHHMFSVIRRDASRIAHMYIIKKFGCTIMYSKIAKRHRRIRKVVVNADVYAS
jgi:hypothetical protein